MSNKTQLQTNNMALEALITRVNAAKDTAASLPEAGGSGGGSIETCIGTLIQSGPPVVPSLDGTVYYVDGSGNFRTTNTPETIAVMKNSILVGYSSGNGQNISGDITSIGGVKVGVMAYHVTGDFSLQI